MANNTPINDILGISMDKIKEMADVNAIIGDTIKLDDGTSIIPISKVSYGFASGGSDIPSKYEKNLFGGGAGAGVSIKPEGFLIIFPNGTVKMVSATPANDPVSMVVDNIPNVVDKISSFIGKKKGESVDNADVSDIVPGE